MHAQMCRCDKFNSLALVISDVSIHIMLNNLKGLRMSVCVYQCVYIYTSGLDALQSSEPKTTEIRLCVCILSLYEC